MIGLNKKKQEHIEKLKGLYEKELENVQDRRY